MSLSLMLTSLMFTTLKSGALLKQGISGNLALSGAMARHDVGQGCLLEDRWNLN